MNPWLINLSARIAPERFKRAAGKQFVTPRARQQSDKGRDWLNGLQIERFDGPLGAQRAYLSGRNPEVFFQHGWEADSADLSTHAKAVRDAGFEVALIDGPAHGASEGQTATMLDFAAGLGAAARAFGQPKAVIAHSMGLPSTVFAIVEHGLDTKQVISLGAPDSLPANATAQGEAMGFAPHTIELLLAGVAHRLGRPIDRFNVALDAQSLPPGALILHGAQDSIVPVDAGERLAAAWPGARLEVFDDLGHRGILRDTTVTTRLIAELSDARKRKT